MLSLHEPIAHVRTELNRDYPRVTLTAVGRILDELEHDLVELDAAGTDAVVVEAARVFDDIAELRRFCALFSRDLRSHTPRIERLLGEVEDRIGIALGRAAKP